MDIYSYNFAAPGDCTPIDYHGIHIHSMCQSLLTLFTYPRGYLLKHFYYFILIYSITAHKLFTPANIIVCVLFSMNQDKTILVI